MPFNSEAGMPRDANGLTAIRRKKPAEIHIPKDGALPPEETKRLTSLVKAPGPSSRLQRIGSVQESPCQGRSGQALVASDRLRWKSLNKDVDFRLGFL